MWESGDIYQTEQVIKSVSQIKRVNISSEYDLELHEATYLFVNI